MRWVLEHPGDLRYHGLESLNQAAESMTDEELQKLCCEDDHGKANYLLNPSGLMLEQILTNDTLAIMICLQ